ncbi:MAG TPA: hypothetical protein VKF15_04160 [Nitrososphaerales archaeon]|nr:hypothetical protein [Nitrososphaerales archaeon]
MVELERLELRVAAAKARLHVVDPPLLTGRSGVTHRFSFLASDESGSFGFDFYDTVGEIELLKSAIKKFDTGALIQVVCLKGVPTPEADLLAKDLEIRILSPETLIRSFEQVLVETTAE